MGESHEELVVSKDLAVYLGDEAIFSQMSTILILLMVQKSCTAWHV